MKKLSFVMPAYKSAATIGKALETLFDQDYKDFEVIVALDGPDEEITKAIAGMLDDYAIVSRLKLLQIEHSGACAARNAGAELATGDYISFFSSDFRAEPGMLRRWMEVFEENPDIDFLYGSYKLWDNPGMAVMADEFNPYTLTCANYIDGGFPLRMSVFREHPWDPQFKSLNDWAFWLDIVLAGHKGMKIPDFSYSAQSPQPGGLSYDSNAHWKERVAQVKRKYGIPDRPVCFCSVQYQEEAKTLAQYMGADYLPMPSFKPHDYKLIYQIGFDAERADVCAHMFTNAPKTRKLIHWMPGDVRKMRNLAVRDVDALADGFGRMGIQSWACTPDDVKFLQKFGFHVKQNVYFALPAQGVNGFHDFKVWLPHGLDDVKKGMPDIPVTDKRNEATLDVLLDRPWGEVAESLLAGKTVVSNMNYPSVVYVPPQPTYPQFKERLVNTLRSFSNAKKVHNPEIYGLCPERKFRRELEALCK